MTEQKACTLCGAGGHLAAQCDWAKSERAKFEAWVLRERPGSPLRYVRDALPIDDPRYGEYCDDTLQCAFEGWLACAAQAGQVPEGWKLVPLEATREQRKAVCMHPDLARVLYNAMVAAAPQPAGGE